MTIGHQMTADVPERSGRMPGDIRTASLREAALQAFSEKGYEGSSLQDIADRIGILKGSLYYYYKSKEELLFAVVKMIHDEHLENARALAAAPGSPLDRLRHLLRGHVLFICNNLPRATVLTREIRRLPHSRVKEILGPEHAYQRIFRDLIVEGQGSGQVAAAINPDLAILWILGALNSIHRWYRSNDAATAEIVSSQFADQLTRGLTASPLWQPAQAQARNPAIQR